MIELTSKTTRKEDTQSKFALYRDVLKVPEYFLFDLLGDYLQPRFQGYRLVRGNYRPMKLEDGRLLSRQLGLILQPEGKELRLIDPETGRRIPTRAESQQAAERARQAAEQARQAAEVRAQEEARGRLRAEAEIEQLRQQLAARNRPNGTSK